MQSTGQGATQSSQPVHCSAMTVCMSFAAPTIASNGHAAMHSVHPMHADSSMRATRSDADAAGRSESRLIGSASVIDTFYRWAFRRRGRNNVSSLPWATR